MGVLSYLNNLKRPASYIWRAFSPARESEPREEAEGESSQNDVSERDISQEPTGTRSDELDINILSKRPSTDSGYKSSIDEVKAVSPTQKNDFVLNCERKGSDSEGDGRSGQLQVSEDQGESSKISQAVQHSQGSQLGRYPEKSDIPNSHVLSGAPTYAPIAHEHDLNGVNWPNSSQQEDPLQTSGRYPIVTNSEENNYFSDTDSETYFHPPAMATNGHPPPRPPPPHNHPMQPDKHYPRQMNLAMSPSPGPPPSVAPPPIPNSPAGFRKLSLQSPPPNAAVYQRLPEQNGNHKPVRFGDAKIKSPSPSRNMVMRNGPPDRKVSAPPSMNYNPLPLNMNGSSNQDMQNIMKILENEETDFVESVKKSKTFIANVIKDKEELGGLVAAHSNKINKLENQRMEYQKRIIEAEREKREFHDKLEQERQNSIQALKRIEIQKQDLEKLQQDTFTITKERNDAVNRLGNGIKQLELLETDKRGLLLKISELSKSQEHLKSNTDMSKNISDLNMKLKMEIAALRGENEGLQKENEKVAIQISGLENKIQMTGQTLQQKESELRSSQTTIDSLKSELTRLKTQLEAVQGKIENQSLSEMQIKVENAQLQNERGTALDKIKILQEEISKVESEKKDKVNEVQSLHDEMKFLKKSLDEVDSNNSSEISSLESSLSQSLNANKMIASKLEEEKRLVSEMEAANTEVKEQIEKLEIDQRKQKEEVKKYLQTISQKNNVEEELLATIKEIKEKVEKYEDEKKAIAKAEKMRKSSVATQEKEIKKECEEKMQKLRMQFDKAAVESKKNITKLTEENINSTALIEELKTDLEKKQVECRGLNTKLSSMEKEFNRYKNCSKEQADNYEKSIEEAQAKISEGRRNADSWKRKHDTVQNDLEIAIKEKYKFKEEIENLSGEMSSLKDNHYEEETNQRNEKTKCEQKLREANIKVKSLEEEKLSIQTKMNSEIGDFSKTISDLKEDLKKSQREKQDLLKKMESLAQENTSAVASEIESRDKTIAQKESEINKLKLSAENKEKELKTNVEKEIVERKKSVNQMSSDIENIRGEVSSKQNLIAKLEKEKREVTINNEKSQKKLNETEHERDKLKDVLSKLESEKKKNNFGKYEKEKMALEIENLTKEKQNVASKLQELSKERQSLTDQIKDFSKMESAKSELSSKNDELNSSLDEFKTKCKELESTMKKERESFNNKEKSQNEKHKTINDEKSNLGRKLKEIEESVTKHKKEMIKIKEELTSKTRSLDEKEKQCSILQKDDKKCNGLSEQIKSLESQRFQLEKNVSNMNSEKKELTSKVSQIEKEKKNLISKVKELEEASRELNQKLAKATASKSNNNDKAELDKFKLNFDSLQKDFESRTAEIEKLTSDLIRAKTDSNSAVEKLRKSESELSNFKEKNAQLSDEILNKSRIIAGMENGSNGEAELKKEVEELKKKLSEGQHNKVKKSVKFSAEPEVLNGSDTKVKELEEALESAYRERAEIMETCRKEVEFHRTIASELEISIMEDFEWKLHEMEKDYNNKLRYSKETVEEQIKEACRGILKEKDDEISKLQIKLRKDMDGKLQKEREELQKALMSVQSGEHKMALEVIKKNLETEFTTKQKKWEEKRKKYHKEIENLKSKVKDKDHDKKNSPNTSENLDSALIEEKRRYDKMSEKFQDDYEKIKEELNGEINRLRADYDEKIEDYQEKLGKYTADKVEKMLVLRDEVEVEYADKMDDLRNMYREEMNNQVGLAEKDKSRMQEIESSLQDSLRLKRQEYEDVKMNYDEATTKVADLEQRLNNQTAEVLRLTTELESYEYE